MWLSRFVIKSEKAHWWFHFNCLELCDPFVIEPGNMILIMKRVLFHAFRLITGKHTAIYNWLFTISSKRIHFEWYADTAFFLFIVKKLVAYSQSTYTGITSYESNAFTELQQTKGMQYPTYLKYNSKYLCIFVLHSSTQRWTHEGSSCSTVLISCILHGPYSYNIFGRP